MTAGPVPTGPITDLTNNTTPFTTASSSAMDAAFLAVVTAINDNWAAYYAGIQAATLPNPDGSVTTAKIRDAAVTAAKILDLAVTRSKIALGAVGSGQLDPTLLENYGDIAVQAKFDQVDAQLGSTTTLATKLGNPARAKYKSTVAKPIPSATWTNPSWDTMVYDTKSFVSQAGNTVINITEAGTYLLIANVSFEPNTIGYRNAMILKNGATAAYQSANAKNESGLTTAIRVIVSTVELCEVGDVLAIQLYQDSGTTVNMNTAVLTFSISKIAGYS